MGKKIIIDKPNITNPIPNPIPIIFCMANHLKMNAKYRKSDAKRRATLNPLKLVEKPAM